MKTLSIIILVFSFFQFGRDSRTLKSEPKLEVKISLNKNKFKIEEEIIVNLEIKNVGKKQEEIIFETRNPAPLWQTFATVIDTKTKKSVVKWQTATISSTTYTENQLKPYKFKIKHGEIIRKKCKLMDIVVFDNSNFLLPKGKYELIVKYYNRSSNKVIFEIL